MTGMTGLDLQDELRARKIDLPVVVITGFGDIPAAVRAMKAGLTFLEKPCRAPELWAAIQSALSHSVRRQSQEQRSSTIQSRFDRLSADERQVLRMILFGKTNKAIASELDVGLRTVELASSPT